MNNGWSLGLFGTLEKVNIFHFSLPFELARVQRAAAQQRCEGESACEE